ncbi:MAG TPA: galactokinase [Verrucomicrobiae bacterium]|nr:galactokinase [Verrucomicrobiae bacterium]
MATTDTQEISTLFKKHFNQTSTHTVRAPGRLELLGNHTDYNDGLVMALAVDRYIFFAASPRTDGKIELISSAFPQPEVFTVDRIEKNPAAPWANYVKGVLLQLRQRGVHFSGFNAAITGTIPMGAGMSSSAALEVGTALIVRKLFPYTLTATGLGTPPQRDANGQLPALAAAERLEMAKVGQAAENQFVGVKCGILDQISSLFGKASSVIDIDCRSLTVENPPMPGEAIIVCNSGVKHELIGGEYNELRQNCENAAAKLGAKFLRTVELKDVEASKGKLTQREYECARHVTSEIARVVAGAKALKAGDHEQFGQFMFQSHESSRDFLKNSTRELDILVELARKHPGCLGARLTGGGFGGATINMVRHHEAQGFIDHMKREYEKAAGIKMDPLVCQIVDGAA